MQMISTSVFLNAAQRIFLNPVGRLRSGWRLSIFAAVFIVLAIFLQAIFRVFRVMLSSLGGSFENLFTGRVRFALLGLLLVSSAVIAGWICTKWLEDLPFAALGWNLHRGWWRDLLFGILLGVGTLLLAGGIAALGGGLTFSFNNGASLNAIIQTVLTSAVIFALAAAGEEAMFRGYPMQTMTRAHLAWLGILLTSVPFAAGHLQNPNVTLFFTFANTVLAGVWLAVAFLKTRSLWLAFGLHFAWNWALAAILGLPVSGFKQITPEPILLGVDTGPAWLTGEAYGLEGGAACTIAILISIVLIWLAPFLKPTAEMFALTNQEIPRDAIGVFPLTPSILGEDKTISSTDNVRDFES